MYTGFLLTPESRAHLLEVFPPKNARTIAHHITLRFGVSPDEPAPEMPKDVEVIGHFDKNGVEGLTVSVDGGTERPDKEVFHITWSLADGRKPVESNKYTRDAVKLKTPIKINVIPKNFHNV